MTKRKQQNRQPAMPTEPPKQNWLQRNTWAPGVFTALVGSGVIFGLISHIQADFDSRIDARFEQKFKDHRFDETAQSVSRIEGELQTLTANVNLLLGKSIKQTASLSVPDIQHQLPQVNGILRAATERKSPTDHATIKALRDKLSTLVKAAEPEAWKAMVSLASYNSVFNENPFSMFMAVPISARGTFWYDPGPFPDGDSRPVMSSITQTATKETGALYEAIGDDLNPQTHATNFAIMLDGGGVVLDGRHIRNVVFRGVHIVYNGGPLILDSAVFIDCRFTIRHVDSGEQFVAQSIDHPTVNFIAKG